MSLYDYTLKRLQGNMRIPQEFIEQIQDSLNNDEKLIH